MYYNNYISYCIFVVNKTHVTYSTYFTFHSIGLGLAISMLYIGCVDLCSSPEGGNNLTQGKRIKSIVLWVLYYKHYTFYTHYFAGWCSPKNIGSLELQESAQRKGHFGLFNCLVIGHTKYKPKGVQRVYCNPFSC